MKHTTSLLFIIALSFSSLKSAEALKLAKALKELALPSSVDEAADLSQKLDDLSLKPEDLLLGQRVLLEACKRNDEDDVRKMIITYNMDPNFQDPKTGRPLFQIALETNTDIAAFLLQHGINPHAFLSPTESIYSESFRRGDTRAISFLLKKRIPYVSKEKKGQIEVSRREDLKKILACGKFLPLTQAFSSGLLTPETITHTLLALAHTYQRENLSFDPHIIPFLQNRSSQKNNRSQHFGLKRLQQPRRYFDSTFNTSE